MVKYTQVIRWQQSMNCLSVFDHFVELALKGLALRSLTYCGFCFRGIVDLVIWQKESRNGKFHCLRFDFDWRQVGYMF